MEVSLRTKYLFIYGVSPFFTGIGVGLVALLDSFSTEAIGSQDFTMYLLESLAGVLGLGIVALILFFIPALIVGICLYYLSQSKTIYQILCALIMGFITPFLPLFVFSGFDQNITELGILMGVLGVITSGLITLKLIYLPFTDHPIDQALD